MISGLTITLVVQNTNAVTSQGSWQCLGSASIELPAHLVARWAPGGSHVEVVDSHRCRFTVGGWSWAGIAGLVVTFDADLSHVRPAELRDAMARITSRLHRARQVAEADGPRSSSSP
ncbi:WYL domain-containing protein [Streptomyces reniochalinae]|uniref:Uncharacterized protein n=1 Tax=Streptomyces reniochalinae TaxID=2250578 RepID=A0A367EI50_9ACTN|nr:hypothetical protein [Streptomyces reniochalinae]RCG17633.1 hypothetical protein DQ392_17460 [Streptomyces reniochalinae]